MPLLWRDYISDRSLSEQFALNHSTCKSLRKLVWMLFQWRRFKWLSVTGMTFQDFDHSSFKLWNFMLRPFFNTCSSTIWSSKAVSSLTFSKHRLSKVLRQLLIFLKRILALAQWVSIYIVDIRRSAHSLKVPVLLKFPEEFLSVWSGLRTRPRLYVLLNLVPVLSILNQAIQEFLMFFISPLTFVVFTRLWLCYCFSLEICWQSLRELLKW